MTPWWRTAPRSARSATFAPAATSEQRPRSGTLRSSRSRASVVGRRFRTSPMSGTRPWARTSTSAPAPSRATTTASTSTRPRSPTARSSAPTRALSRPSRSARAPTSPPARPSPRTAPLGRPSDENAHPPTDCRGDLVVVHNGILENYLEIKDRLRGEGHAFRSETDTEVLAHLIEHHLKTTGRLERAVKAALAEVTGSYASGVVSTPAPDRLNA